VKFTGALPVEQAAAIRAVLDAYLNPRAGATVQFTPNPEDTPTVTVNGQTQPIELQAPADPRTRGQKAADVLHAVFSAAARAPETPSMGGAHPTVLVVIDKNNLETGHGVAHVDGEAEPITAKAAKRIAETGGYQDVERDAFGQILNLGRTKRFATVAQRRALAVRDKGCIIPGCPIPDRWTEVHHIVPDRDDGPTDILNLTLLCWFHHLTIDDGPYEIRMPDDGTPEIRWVFGSHASAWVKAVHRPKHDLTPAA
jgi:hypothetical protein